MPWVGGRALIASRATTWRVRPFAVQLTCACPAPFTLRVASPPRPSSSEADAGPATAPVAASAPAAMNLSVRARMRTPWHGRSDGRWRCRQRREALRLASFSVRVRAGVAHRRQQGSEPAAAVHSVAVVVYELHIVAVGIEDERAVVAPVIERPLAGGAVVGVARRGRSPVEGGHRLV